MLTTNYPLLANQIAEFQQNGHIYLPQVVTEEILHPYRHAIRNWSSDFQAKQKPIEERDTYGRGSLRYVLRAGRMIQWSANLS